MVACMLSKKSKHIEVEALLCWSIFQVSFGMLIALHVWCQHERISKRTFWSQHNDSLWHPFHTKEGDEISMFWWPCLQSSISTLSFSFLALFFCYAVSSCVYDHNHPYLVSERLFLAENKAFPYLRRALAHPRRALAILWDAAATWPVVIFVVVATKQRSPKMSEACVQGLVDRSPYRSPPVTLNGHCGVIFQSIFKPNISLERSCPGLNEHVFFWIGRSTGRTAAVRSLPTHRFRD